MLMAQYDPTIIQAHADNLYSRAWLGQVLSTAGGVIAGLIYVNGWTSEMARQEVSTWLVPLSIGMGLGWLAGSGAAFAMRLQAQLMLCQLQVEINTRPLAPHDDDPDDDDP